MFDVAYRFIEQLIRDNWVATPIAWDNVEYVPVAGTAFVRVTITQVDAVLTTGNALTGNYRESGLITVQVFTPHDQGGQINAELSTDMQNILRGYSIDRLYIQAPRVVRVGQYKEFFQNNVLTEFYYDNCIAAAP